jgi:hypothetical protein
MRAKLLFVAFAAALSAVNCSSKGGGLIQPSPTPIPDQTRYEPLGDAAPRHYLKDESGKITTMWIRLLSVTPERGSVLTFGNTNGICPSKCQQFLAEAGQDQDPDVGGLTTIGLGWSPDCVNPSTLWGEGTTIVPGTSSTFGDGRVHYFRDFAPKCFYVQGDYSQKGTALIKRGVMAIPLDYQMP